MNKWHSKQHMIIISTSAFAGFIGTYFMKKLRLGTIRLTRWILPIISVHRICLNVLQTRCTGYNYYRKCTEFTNQWYLILNERNTHFKIFRVVHELKGSILGFQFFYILQLVCHFHAIFFMDPSNNETKLPNNNQDLGRAPLIIS